jgi:hypothetical protein
VDGDGDVDVLVCAPFDRIFWHENDGAGNPCDCARKDPTVHQRLAAVTDLLASSPLEGQPWLQWSGVSSAEGYSPLRGDLSTLAVGQYGTCLDSDVSATSYDDPTLPAAGSGYSYLVRATSDACDDGPLGPDYSGDERISTTPCP